MEDYTQDFKDLVVLYTKTKSFILRAEQTDPDSASNIAVFKEQRDAADHLMRVLGTIYCGAIDGVEDPNAYIKTHFEKARSHLFRAAFDSLDGIGLSCKLLLKESLKGISNEAISAVYPDYWKRVVEFDNLDHEVTSHRNSKDIGRNTLAHLDSYAAVVDRLYSLTQELRQRVPHLHEWEARNKQATKKDVKTFLKKEGLKFLLFAVIGGLLLKALEGPVVSIFSKPSPNPVPPQPYNMPAGSTNNTAQTNPPSQGAKVSQP